MTKDSTKTTAVNLHAKITSANRHAINLEKRLSLIADQALAIESRQTTREAIVLRVGEIWSIARENSGSLSSGRFVKQIIDVIDAAVGDVQTRLEETERQLRDERETSRKLRSDLKDAKQQAKYAAAKATDYERAMDAWVKNENERAK